MTDNNPLPIESQQETQERATLIRVGITQGDTNGVGYELIYKTFSDPAMFEMCTPIVFCLLYTS